MKQPLTKCQSEVFTFIRIFISNNMYAPTLEDISGEFNISKSTAQGYIQELQLRGWIVKLPFKARALIVKEGI